MISDGGGRRMLRIPSTRTSTSQATSNPTETAIGENSSSKACRSLALMARLDAFAQVPDVAVEAFLLGHGDRARTRQFDPQLVDHGCRPAAHDHDAVGQEGSLADGVSDKDHGFPVGLPDAQELHRHVIAGDGVESAERLVHEKRAWVVDKRPADGRALAHAARELTR